MQGFQLMWLRLQEKSVVLTKIQAAGYIRQEHAILQAMKGQYLSFGNQPSALERAGDFLFCDDDGIPTSYSQCGNNNT